MLEINNNYIKNFTNYKWNPYKQSLFIIKLAFIIKKYYNLIKII